MRARTLINRPAWSLLWMPSPWFAFWRYSDGYGTSWRIGPFQIVLPQLLCTCGADAECDGDYEALCNSCAVAERETSLAGEYELDRP